MSSDRRRRGMTLPSAASSESLLTLLPSIPATAEGRSAPLFTVSSIPPWSDSPAAPTPRTYVPPVPSHHAAAPSSSAQREPRLPFEFPPSTGRPGEEHAFVGARGLGEAADVDGRKVDGCTKRDETGWRGETQRSVGGMPKTMCLSLYVPPTVICRTSPLPTLRAANRESSPLLADLPLPRVPPPKALDSAATPAVGNAQRRRVSLYRHALNSLDRRDDL
ncbi:hypothetical protein R3P38DRAFT_3215387 [Favolaschia claudopus]|uniref:Uncharacterized protein n=1 Tax=Favolaschia claudopus TaxID=2862362 RepID=A0AAW0A8D4_9AGAR